MVAAAAVGAAGRQLIPCTASLQQHAAQQAAPPHQHAPPLALKRRQVITALPSLLGIAAVAAASPSTAAAAETGGGLAVPAQFAVPEPAPGPILPGSLAARMATAGSIQQPGYMPPWAPKQLYFPRWLFGEWEVEMEFVALRTPLGRTFVPPGFLQAAEAPAEDGGLGSTYRFRQRFYSTLPDTLDNQLRVNLGLGMPQDAIIADRAFNTKETTNAFLGWQAVESVEYDPRAAPLRQIVTLSRLAPDLAPLPPRRLELFINSLASEEGPAAGGPSGGGGLQEGAAGNSSGSGSVFYTSELCRQVLLGVRQAEVKDYELLHSYQQAAPGLVTGRQRSCLYLQPQEQLYFQAAGRAVAVYDYTFRMRRVAPDADAPAGAVACVQTPKRVFQCV